MNLPHHGKYVWLPLLYDLILDFKPKKIVEFGPGRGQTTVTMALALQKIGEGKINSYDIWNDDYWGDNQDCIGEFQKWGVNDLINLEKMDFYDWIKLSDEDKQFDILYFDIDNNGDKISDLYENVKHNINNGSIVLFEGGSIQRDEYCGDNKKMSDVKEQIGYKVLTGDVKYSFSIIYNENLYNLEY